MTMKLVINIPETTYDATCKGNMLPPDVKNVVEAIKNGTPLIDERVYRQKYIGGING